MSRKSQSYEERERRKCRSKERFDTLQEAGARQAHAWKHSKLRLQIYICNWCEKFHLTSSLRDAALEAFKIAERQALNEMKSSVKGIIK